MWERRAPFAPSQIPILKRSGVKVMVIWSGPSLPLSLFGVALPLPLSLFGVALPLPLSLFGVS